tara:strand:- start:6527 stop:6760 length:234 start_codon:yes stop_codon:yes gene_type:complete
VLAVCSLLLLSSCAPEENDPPCNCEEVFYEEAKYQDESTDEWLLSRIEIYRETISCQDETDFIRTGNGTEASRIECN